VSIPFSWISFTDNYLKVTSPTLRIWGLYFFSKSSSCFHLPLLFTMIVVAFLWPLTHLWSMSLTSPRLSVMILMSSVCSTWSCFFAWARWWPKESLRCLQYSSHVQPVNAGSLITPRSHLRNCSSFSKGSKITSWLHFRGTL
jgi:hypothetical protein